MGHRLLDVLEQMPTARLILLRDIVIAAATRRLTEEPPAYPDIATAIAAVSERAQMAG